MSEYRCAVSIELEGGDDKAVLRVRYKIEQALAELNRQVPHLGPGAVRMTIYGGSVHPKDPALRKPAG
jgi:hypothetical protein